MRASTCCTRWAGTPSACPPSSTRSRPACTPRSRPSATSTTSAPAQALGFSYDWEREVDTTDPRYYKWTQWIFLQALREGPRLSGRGPGELVPRARHRARQRRGHRRQAASAAATPSCAADAPVDAAITAYAERLLETSTSTGPSRSRRCSATGSGARGRRGRVRGRRHAKSSTVFTTRPDTLFGATYMVLAPEHPLVAHHDRRAARRRCGLRQPGARKSDLERTELAKEKTGVFTGAFAINPVNGAKIPIWIADYVLDLLRHRRDHGRARPRRARLRVRASSASRSSRSSPARGRRRRSPRPRFTGDGARSTPASSTACRPPQAKARITSWLEARASASVPTVNYKLRDWLFSRQRYWGEPFPVIFDEAGKPRSPLPVPESELPVTPARARRLQAQRTASRRWPRIPEWVNTDPTTGGARPRARPTPCRSGRARAGTTCASSTRRTTRAVGPAPRKVLDARRPLRRRRRARGAAPALRALLAQGALRLRRRLTKEPFQRSSTRA
jgi:leucyl-tRNA synthetase